MQNSYNDTQRAAAYAKLKFPGTYSLAYRDLPEIINQHVTGRKALDVGCGAGRSTRFLQQLGFNATGVDIAEEMIQQAREKDPHGKYQLVPDGDLSKVNGHAYDLAMSVFTFDNIPTMEKKVTLFKEMGSLLSNEGRIVNLVSSPQIYTHEWASFSTEDFPENLTAKTGDTVKIIITDIEDARPVEDVLWADDAYHEVFNRSGLEVVAIYKPLADEHEPYPWINETRIAPWVIYVLKNTEKTPKQTFCM
jgi:SAM-dependent methyltransferase